MEVKFLPSWSKLENKLRSSSSLLGDLLAGSQEAHHYVGLYIKPLPPHLCFMNVVVVAVLFCRSCPTLLTASSTSAPCPWAFQAIILGLGCYFLAIFPNQGSNPSPCVDRQILTTEPPGCPGLMNSRSQFKGLQIVSASRNVYQFINFGHMSVWKFSIILSACQLDHT